MHCTWNTNAVCFLIMLALGFCKPRPIRERGMKARRKGLGASDARTIRENRSAYVIEGAFSVLYNTWQKAVPRVCVCHGSWVGRREEIVNITLGTR